MNYYINPIWFYIMQVSDYFRVMSFVCALLIIGIGSFLYYVYYDDGEEDTELRPKGRKFILAGIILIIIAALCPSEKTCLRMIVASQVTKENVSSAKEEIYDIVDYIDEKLNDDKE